MDINEDGSMQVEESIEVNFSESRHGIYRDIPLGISGDYLTVQDITANTPINSITTRNNTLSLQLGSPNTTVRGEQTYTISYTVKNSIKTFSGGDEFYRNIIWGQWDTTIDRTTWTINLPKPYQQYTWSSFVVRGDHGEQWTWNIEFLQTTPTQRRGVLSTQLQTNQWVTVWLQFSWHYFVLPIHYDDYFIHQENEQPSKPIAKSIRSNIRNTVGPIIPVLFRWMVVSWFAVSKKIRSPRKSKKPIITQYHPPQDIDISYAFYLWYNNKDNPKLFTSVLYHRATSGWVTISKEKMEWVLSRFGVKDQYFIIEKQLRPDNTSEIDDTLLQQFFWTYDTTLDKIPLSENSYTKIKWLVDVLAKKFEQQELTQKKSGFRWFVGLKELTPRWREVFEHLRGYKEYLSKVEQPVIESELKTDPEFINKILPWAVLFGVETRLLKMVEDVIKNVDWYKSNDWSFLTYTTFNAMNTKVQAFSTPPRSSGSSGFSWGGGGWFSWGGRWGGGGWSW